MDYDMLNFFMKYFSRAMMLLLVLPIVNCAKGAIAKKLGDDTAESAGRITLNPMAHLDLLGSLMIMLIGFGWSKPMPINYLRMKNSKAGIIILALAGSLTLLLMSIICRNIAMTVSIFVNSMAGVAIARILELLSSISVSLAVLHLLPFPGMDGFTLLYHIAGKKFAAWYHRNKRIVDQVSFYLMLFLFFIGDLTQGRFDPLLKLIATVDLGLQFTTVWQYFVFM